MFALVLWHFNNSQADSDFISAVPHISTVPLSPTEEFLVLASDGLWVEIEDQDLVELIGRARERGRLWWQTWLIVTGETPEQIVSGITQKCAKGQFSDNITVMLLIFDWKEIPSNEKPLIIADPIQPKMVGNMEVYAPQ